MVTYKTNNDKMFSRGIYFVSKLVLAYIMIPLL